VGCSGREANGWVRSGWGTLVVFFPEFVLGTMGWLECRDREAPVTAGTRPPPSDNARSSFRISALCDLLAFLGARATILTTIAQTISALATPINRTLGMSTILLKKWPLHENCALAEGIQHRLPKFLS